MQRALGTFPLISYIVTLLLRPLSTTALLDVKYIFDLAFFLLKDSLVFLHWKVSDTISDVSKKAGPFTDEVACGFYRRFFKKLKKAAVHYLPRKEKGYIHFGTGRSDLTGIAAGFLNVILPAGADVSLQPDFYEALFDAEISGCGHIRACHIVWLLASELVHKDTRTMLKRIKNIRK